MGDYVMPWTESKYSKNKINKAGKKICRDDLSDDEKKEAYKIVGNWRAAHAYPLYVITKKLRNLCGRKSMAVHRLKRMESIKEKLERFEQMSLFGMQDIGGCRVIVPTVDDVYKIANAYENSRIRHILCKENDYLKNPKKDGYRSLHRVYEYKSDDPNSKYNKMKIEIQFRTKLQHLWATAVEVMSLYTGSNLKSGVGDEHYFRFFALVSSLFAIKEGTEIVPNTPPDRNDLIDEILNINEKYAVLDKLSSMSKAIRVQGRVRVKGEYEHFLMSLNTDTGLMRIGVYDTSHFANAIDEYNKMEQIPNTNNVLVSAKSIKELREGYPNYFGDIRSFISTLSKLLVK